MRVPRPYAVDSGRSYFDTNTADHHHTYIEETGELRDIPIHSVALDKLPPPPEGTEIAHRRNRPPARMRGEGELRNLSSHGGLGIIPMC